MQAIFLNFALQGSIAELATRRSHLAIVLSLVSSFAIVAIVSKNHFVKVLTVATYERFI